MYEIRKDIPVGEMRTETPLLTDALRRLEIGDCVTIPPGRFVYPLLLDMWIQEAGIKAEMKWDSVTGWRIWRVE
jgi:hypothetical protein